MIILDDKGKRKKIKKMKWWVIVKNWERVIESEIYNWE